MNQINSTIQIPKIDLTEQELSDKENHNKWAESTAVKPTLLGTEKEIQKDLAAKLQNPKRVKIYDTKNKRKTTLLKMGLKRTDP